MARPRRVDCRICERHVSECGPLSARGKCQACALGRFTANALQLHEHDGEWFEHWRKRGVASYGGVLLDDL